jgi:hypothetical protein
MRKRWASGARAGGLEQDLVPSSTALLARSCESGNYQPTFLHRLKLIESVHLPRRKQRDIKPVDRRRSSSPKVPFHRCSCLLPQPDQRHTSHRQNSRRAAPDRMLLCPTTPLSAIDNIVDIAIHRSLASPPTPPLELCCLLAASAAKTPPR